MLHRLTAGGLALALTASLLAQTNEIPPVAAAMQHFVAELRLDGAGLAVLRDDGELHRSHHGTFRADEPLPIASASKWLAVAAVLTLVDDGALDLDAPVARYLKEFDRPDKRAITLRQCLSCTTGFAARMQDRMRGWDMDAFVAEAADDGLLAGPGTAFRYGNVGFQVAAAAAERATGKSWHELFAERVAAPVGMTATKFGTALPVGANAGTAKLPWVAGGAVSTLDDYARFLRMLLAKGRAAERQVLLPESVEAMLRDQVAANVEVRAVGFDADDVRYGLGTWIETLDGGLVRCSDPGAFGFTPWIDLDLGIGGVLAVRDRVTRVLPRLRAVQDEVRRAAQSPAVAGTDTEVTLPHGGRDRRYSLHVPPRAEGSPGLPLVVVLHGGGGNGDQVREATGFAELADREGFVVAFPDGTGPLRGKLLTWNSGGIPVYAVEHDVDDTGFLRAVVADAMKRVAVDPLRVYAVGHSNGAMMCHRLAREAPDVFAGIAAVAGAMNFVATDSAIPIACMLVHGTADDHVRFEGGRPRESVGRSGDRVDASVQDAIDYYLQRNGLRGYPEATKDGKVRVETYATGPGGKPAIAPLRVVTLEGGGHAWPGMPQQRRRGDAPFPFDATRAIWQFLSAARLQQGGVVPAMPR